MLTAQPTTSDALLARIAQGDRKALTELYDHLAPRLHGLMVRIVSDRRESERLLEELFIRLWREAGHIRRARASVSAWLALRAQAQAIARVRAGRGGSPAGQGSSLGSGVADLFRQTPVWLPDPAAIGLLEERRALLQKVLHQLPPHQLQAVELVAFGGYTEAELDRELGEPLGRVKTELRAAMRFLRHRRRAVVGSWAVSI